MNAEQLTALEKNFSEFKPNNIVETKLPATLAGTKVYLVTDLKDVVITNTNYLNKELLRIYVGIDFHNWQTKTIKQLIEEGILPKTDKNYVLDYYQQHIAKKYNQIGGRWRPSPR